VAIVAAMAAHARHRCVLVDRALVTGLALNASVLAQQWKARLRVVEPGLLPTALEVTALARSPEAAAMLVVLAVAGHAAAVQLVPIQHARVAALTLELGVPAAQGIAGVGVMVEAHLGPSACAVAALAFLAEARSVLVVFAVAGHAGPRCLAEMGIAVAALALHGRVLAGEWKPRLGVIEGGFLPALLDVTVGALGAQAGLVHVVLAMAVDAGARCGAKLRVRAMAGAALHRGVLVSE
jgi:hypothetical protein